MQKSWILWSLIGLLLLVIFCGYFIYKKRTYQGQMRLANGDFVTYQGYLDADQIKNWQQILLTQVNLLKEAGWPKLALTEVYLKGLTVPQDRETQARYLAERLKEVQVFGSSLFCQMWQKVSRRDLDREQARKLLELSLTLVPLGPGLSGEIEQIEALLACFSDELSPAHAFWSNFAYVVQTAFPATSLGESEDLAKLVHQFRYVISAQQAQWVRQHYGRSEGTDAQALTAYLRALKRREAARQPRFSYSVKDSARLHNKIVRAPQSTALPQKVYPDQRSQINFKVLFNFHTEFILSDSGQFLNEVDPQGQTDAGIINGASFNYAHRHPKRHWELDIFPIKAHDPAFRKQVIQQEAYPYMAPNRERHSGGKNWEFSYFNHQGLYAQDNQSLESLVRQAGRQFKAEVEQPFSFFGFWKK